MRNPKTKHADFLTCAVRDEVVVLTLEQDAFDIALDLKARDNFFSLLTQVEQMQSVKALLVINSPAYPDVDRQRQYLETLTHDTGISLGERERMLSVVAHTRYRILEKLIGYQKLVVAAMQGAIASPFFGLSLGFPIRLAADDVVLRFSRAEFHLPPSWPLCVYLPRYVGQGKATEILLSGEPVEAATLAELELVHHVYPADRFEDYCLEHTVELCRLPGSQISGINRMLSPEPSEISSGFKQSMSIMRKALHSAQNTERDIVAPAHHQ